MSEIFVAESVDCEPPPKRRWWLWILLSIILGSIAAGILISIWLGQAEKQLNGETSPAVLTLQPQQRFADVRNAFAEPSNDLTQADHVAISKFVGEMMQLAVEPTDAMYDKIDVTGFLRQMQRCGEYPGMGFADRGVIRRDFSYATTGPKAYDHFRVVSIKRLSDYEVIVYLYAWSEVDRVRELRWWLVRKGDQWKLADWESIRNGMTEATEYAILCENQEHVGIENYYSSMDAIDPFVKLANDGNEDEAVRILEGVQRLVCHKKLVDQRQLTIAFLWTYLWRLDDAKAAFASVKDPESVPGAYYGQAFCEYELGNYELALEWIEKFLLRVGASPNAMRIKADCLMMLERDAEALEAFQRLAEMIPGDADADRNIARLMSEMPLEALKGRISEIKSPAKVAMGIIDSVNVVGDLPKIEAAKLIMGENLDYPELDDYVRGIKSSINYDYEAAIASYRAAMEKAYDSTRSDIYRMRWMELMSSIGQQVECYDASDDKAAAFHLLVELYDQGDADFPPQRLLSLVEKHRGVAPDEPWLPYYHGLALNDLKRTEEAVARFDEGRKRFPEEVEGRVASSCEYYLNSILMQQGNWQRAYDESADKETAFGLIANHLLELNQAQSLGALHKQHSQSYPDAQVSRYFASRIKMLDGDFKSAQADLMGQRDDLAAAGSEADEHSVDSGTANDVRRALAECLLKTGDWAKLLTQTDTDEAQIQDLWRAMVRTSRFDQLPRLVKAMVADQHKELRFDFAMRLAEISEDDRRLVRLFKARPDSEDTSWDYRVGLAAIRIGDIALAQKLAKAESDDDPRLPFLLGIKTGDQSAVKESLEEIKSDVYLQSELTTEPLAEAFWVGDKFADARDDFAPKLNSYVGDFSIYLLYSKKPKMPIAELKELLNSFSEDDVELAKLVGVSGDQEASAVVASYGNSRFVLSQLKRLELDAGLSPGKEVETCLASHRYTLAATIARGASNKDAFEKVFKVARVLLTEDCVGAYCPELRKLVTNPQAQFPKVDPFDRRTFSPGEDWAWLIAKSYPGEMEPWRRYNQSTQQTADADALMGKEVRIMTLVGPIRVNHWLRVIGYDLESPNLLTCEFIDSPQLYPVFKQGDRIQISRYEVYEWK